MWQLISVKSLGMVTQECETGVLSSFPEVLDSPHCSLSYHLLFWCVKNKIPPCLKARRNKRKGQGQKIVPVCCEFRFEEQRQEMQVSSPICTVAVPRDTLKN